VESAAREGEMKNKDVVHEEGMKIQRKAHCHRCYAKGHVMNDCVAKLYCEVCDVDSHIKQRCPIFNVPKVHAVLAGFAINKGGFFHIPTNKKLVKQKGDSKVALILVSDGVLTLDNVVCELKRLLPHLAPWKVDQIDQGTFKTIFQSSLELNRMVEWGPVRAKTQKATLEFKVCSSGGRVKAKLVDTWIQFNGLPVEFCTVPHIWGVGSTLGVASDVDMAFYRHHGICRMQVSVIDPQAIPFAVDVEVAKVFYEVHLWVENGAGTAVPMAVDDDSFFDDDADSKSEDKGSDRNNEDGLNRKENASDQALNKLAGGDNTGHKLVALGEVTTIAGQPIDGVLAAGSLGFGQELPADPLESSMDGNVVDDEKLLMSDAVGKAKQSEVVAAVTDQVGAVIADHVPMDSPELMQSPDDSCDKLKQLAAILEASQSVAAGRKRRTSITDENSLARA
jgi:hypothetical protein